jgi:Skp family chaperone for outer membrane proteins
VAPNILALIISAIGASAVVAIAASAAVKIARAIAGRGASSSEIAYVKQQLEQHAAELQDAQTTLADQSAQLADLQERLDFAERLLAQARDRPALGPGGQAR